MDFEVVPRDMLHRSSKLAELAGLGAAACPAAGVELGRMTDPPKPGDVTLLLGTKGAPPNRGCDWACMTGVAN